MQIDEDKLTREAMQLLGLVGVNEWPSPNEIELGRVAIRGLLCPFSVANALMEAYGKTIPPVECSCRCKDFTPYPNAERCRILMDAKNHWADCALAAEAALKLEKIESARWKETSHLWEDRIIKVNELLQGSPPAGDR